MRHVTYALSRLHTKQQWGFGVGFSLPQNHDGTRVFGVRLTIGSYVFGLTRCETKPTKEKPAKPGPTGKVIYGYNWKKGRST